MIITGSNFPTNLTNIYINNNDGVFSMVQVLTVTSIQIVFVTPSLNRGNYSLLIPCGNQIGNA